MFSSNLYERSKNNYRNKNNIDLKLKLNKTRTMCFKKHCDLLSQYGPKSLTFLYHGCINLMMIVLLLLVTKHKPLL